MKIITAGLSDAQRVEAVMKGAHVDEHRARAMLAEEGGWDAVVVGGTTFVGPTIFDAKRERDSSTAAVGELVAVKARAFYGEATAIGDSSGTFLVTIPGDENSLVPH